MSKYTTEVRYICETSAGLKESAGYDSVSEIISKSIPVIFNFDFPIFDEAYRTVLETKILKHYYTREIGQESIGLWKLRLDTKLNEIMPYYNKLYQSELLNFNPLYNFDITRSHNVEGSGSRTTGSTGQTTQSNSKSNEQSSNGTDLYSDTPQGAISGLYDNTYLTNARKIDNESSSSETGSLSEQRSDTGSDEYSNTEEYIEHVTGYQGQNASELLKKFRETFLNIDLMVINELEDLFFQLW